MAKLMTGAVSGSESGGLHSFGFGFGWLMTWIGHHFGNEGVSKATDAIVQARAAGVSWLAIFEAVVGLLANLVNGKGITIQDIIDAILKLIPKPTP
jgi:hypothetical protein